MIPPSILFRQATFNDVSAIAAVKNAVWPDEPANTSVISDALQTPTHHAHLVLVDDRVAGFVSCFVTKSMSGEKRWEIDLLAVHPNYRRRGLATKLVEAAIAIGKSHSCDLARALIQIDNIGSQRSFAHSGFTTDGQIQTLFVCTEAAETDAPATLLSFGAKSGCHLVKVNTLGYSGIWLENPLSAEAFGEAKAELKRTDATVAGAIIPDADKANCACAQANRFEPMGKFQLWFREF